MPANEKVFSFLWKIENFSMLPHQSGECIKSPKFVVDVWKDFDFCLMLYPRGNAQEEYMSLYLEKHPEDHDLKLNFTLAVESTKPSEKILKNIEDHVLKMDWGYSKFILLHYMYSNKNYFLPQDTLTVRCELIPTEEPAELNTKQDTKNASTLLRKYCVSRTCIQVQRRSVTWSIGNVKELLHRFEKTSIRFTTAQKNSPCLKLTLNFNNISSDDEIPIMIQRTDLSSKKQRLFVKCKITIMSTHEEYQTSKTSSYLFQLSTSDMWNFPSFLKTNMLKDEKFLKVDDTLFLRCEFAFSYKDSVHHLENNYLPFTFETRQKISELSNSLENILGCGKFCDIELRAGGRTFPYYKVLLCARSSLFTAMFENNMKEKESNIIEIEDVDPDTLQRMLTYMHSDVLPEDLSPEDTCSLYRVADKYNFVSLKNKCSVLLATAVSVLNVCELLVLAEAHLDNFLMTTINDFICNNTIEVFNSVQWKTFMEDNPNLSCKVMHEMLTGKRQF